MTYKKDKDTGHWLIVASRDHVFAGKKEGIVQASHGKSTSLEKMNIGDWIVFYSPKKIYGDTEPYQKFVAIARVTGKEVFQVSLSDTFKPYRRQAEYLDDIYEIDIRPLISDMFFINDKFHWGVSLRSGFRSISREDFMLICKSMRKKNGT